MYSRKFESTIEAFAAQRAAEQKRRRKQLRNLERALTNHTPISTRHTSVLWTLNSR